jgi:alpha-beta hydrolase superfamily lysophospholipase/SAM-dependent methyltransferase
MTRIQTVPQRGVQRLSRVEQTFTSFDSSELFYRAWLPTSRIAHKAIVLVHRGHEHGGRWEEFVLMLGVSDTAIFAHDLRGHGRSPGERGYAQHFADHVRDLDVFTKHVSLKYDVPVENMVVLGHSVGAVVAAAWVHDYAPPIRGMVLATPALRVKLYVPLARQGLTATQAIKGKSFIKSYVKPKMLTHDPEQAAAYAADPLISRQIAVNVLLDLHDTSTRLIADAGAIRTPTLLFAAGSDWVVKNSAIRKFHDRLSSRDKSLHVLAGFSHAIFHEKDRALPISLTRDFIERVFRVTGPPRSLIHADDGGYTRKEFDRIQQPRPLWCPKRISFAAQRAVLKTVGRLSQGIRIGWEYGFDSGQSLDHVYRNRASGLTPIGRLIDRIYLNAIGWRGVRVRKEHLQQMLRRTIEMTHQAGKHAKIVDIASGPGRYLLEAISTLPQDRISVLLRDSNEEGLGRARAIAMRLKLQNIDYVAADAFDYDSLAGISPKPNIAIVSGLYELFDRNDKVLASLRGLADAMRSDGGYLIYTNQPWHPQIEMIARCLTNRDGRPWVMRRRTTEEMDDLVKAAGFEKIDMLIDRWGIFAVSLARRA